MVQRLYFLIFILSGSLNAQSAGISGVVVDGRTRKPIVGARLVIQTGEYTTQTDAEGRFAKALPASVGYHPVRV